MAWLIILLCGFAIASFCLPFALVCFCSLPSFLFPLFFDFVLWSRPPSFLYHVLNHHSQSLYPSLTSLFFSSHSLSNSLPPKQALPFLYFDAHLRPSSDPPLLALIHNNNSPPDKSTRTLETRQHGHDLCISPSLSFVPITSLRAHFILFSARPTTTSIFFVFKPLFFHFLLLSLPSLSLSLSHSLSLSLTLSLFLLPAHLTSLTLSIASHLHSTFIPFLALPLTDHSHSSIHHSSIQQ
ncbi:MAG: hypothetical protein JOS17DRAFT_543409 [Linnemannia elongata]|nr:MAG: hypothetical protein JOS17DRAFT_543409 [Linnemannia elongata]